VLAAPLPNAKPDGRLPERAVAWSRARRLRLSQVPE